MSGGAGIPMGPVMQYVDERLDPLTLRIWPGTEWTLYEDDGHAAGTGLVLGQRYRVRRMDQQK